MLHDLKFWESHPFTLSSWNEGHAEDADQDGKGERITSDRNLSFIIRPRNSFTDRLRRAVSQRQGTNRMGNACSASLRVVLEGPYGHQLELKQYDFLLFVVGGTGVTVAVSHLCGLYHSVGHPRPTVRLVRAIREVALFRDVLEKDLDQWLTSPKLQGWVQLEIQVYVTADSISLGDTDNSAETSGS